MQRILIGVVICILGSMGAGCSTYIYGTAPAKAPNTVYAVGAKAGFFSVSPKIWVCSANPSPSTECTPVDVVLP